ncbi:MAG TPA: pyridoxamine 5'-phosphate oxidase family protein [Streptosporangiaceae bacterium]|jgi:PPOX class probable F420-dependent enzyme
MSLSMSRDEREQFLADLHVGVLTVAAADGRGPLAVPVWYSYQPGGVVSVTSGGDSRKAAAIRVAGRASFCVQYELPPYRYVTVEGPAVVEQGAEFTERRDIARRYLGTEQGDKFMADNPDTDDVMIRITPERWLTADFGKQGS